MDKESETKEHVQYLKLLNSGTKNLTFHLEPWGDQFPMIPNESEYQIVARGPDNDCLSIHFGDDNKIVVYGWTGSVVSVYKDDKRLVRYTMPLPPGI